jgi:acyl-CoA synthetase (AMP-forming)/AMP-acid ligase II
MKTMAGLTRVLIEHAQARPDATACEFHHPGGGLATLSYAELHARALRAAWQITRHQNRARQPVVLLFPPGLGYVTALYGCFLAGVPAVPAYPPDPRRPEVSGARLNRILSDLGPATILTDRDVLAIWPAQLGQLRPALVVAGGDQERVGLPAPRAEDTALIQYTSGSTTEPKGVVIRHRNLEHNIRAITRYMHVGLESRALIWLPPYHDMGLIGGILTPLFTGFPVRLMSPFEFLKRPISWLRQISESGATVTGGPNFAYDLCVRKHAKESGDLHLDLSRWNVAFNGAESVRQSTMEAFSATFSPFGFDPRAFFPCYGLAEATLLVSGGHWDPRRPARGAQASCGTPLPDQTLVVVSTEDGQPVADGTEGEILVSGPSVADRYWGDSDGLHSFILRDGRRFLRTGDLGHLSGGELVVTGKIADVLVQHGANYHAIDIERAAVAGAAELRPLAAAFMVGEEGRQDVVVVVESGQTCDRPGEAAARVRNRVLVATGLTVSTVVVGPAGTVPRTSSGKVQRQLCRSRYLETSYDSLVAFGGAVPSHLTYLQ